MKRIVLWALLALFIAGTAVVPSQAQEEQPNILMVTMSSAGYATTGAYGQGGIFTPNLDSFASQGMQATKFRVGATTCNPSRAVVLSALNPIHSADRENFDNMKPGVTTLHQYLQVQGYATAMYGRFIQGMYSSMPPHPMDSGADTFLGTITMATGKSKTPPQIYQDRTLVPNTEYTTHRYADAAISRIQTLTQSNPTQPWFIDLVFNAPGFDVTAPSNPQSPYTVAYYEGLGYSNPNARYAAMVSEIDKKVGDLLLALDNLDIDDNTIVIVSSDHGAPVGSGEGEGAPAFFGANSTFRGQIGDVYDGNLRTFFMARWPGHIPVGANDKVFFGQDVFPTLRAAIGQQPDPTVDGVDVLDLWTDPQATLPTITRFWVWGDNAKKGALSADGRWKAVGIGSSWSLYDLDADPNESTPVVNPTVLSQLKAEWNLWMNTRVLLPVYDFFAWKPSPTSVKVQWKDDTGLESGFRIKQSFNGGAWTQVGSVGMAARSFTKTGLVPGDYQYKIESYDAIGTTTSAIVAITLP